jgi:hypothetical protein
MSKRLTLILVLAFVIGISCAAFAEVQNVKVGGDLKMSGVVRHNFDLKNSGTAGNKENDQGNFLMSQIRLRVDADLTDNVTTTLRLINERNWDAEDTSNTDIDLDLAFVTMKEFLYSPLTMTVGRQELKFGNQLIIGKALTYNRGVLNGVPRDLGIREAFDAIRATLNYDPLMVDMIYAKIDETLNVESASPNYRNEDSDLYGINARYQVNKDIAVEGYCFTKLARSTTSTIDKNDWVNAVGMLLSATPKENLKTSLEMAYQFGKYRSASKTNPMNAWALQAMADYTFAKVKYTPNLGIRFTHLSGGKEENNKDAWDPMYNNQTLNNITKALIPFSNLNVINLIGSIKPKEDLTLTANYGYYRLNEKMNSMTDPYLFSASTWTMSTNKSLGNALDLTATYEYTEDVELALTAGWFKPGNAFNLAYGKRDATQVIGSMKVTF